MRPGPHRRTAALPAALVAAALLSCGRTPAPPPAAPPPKPAAPFRTVAIGIGEDYPEESRSIARARRDLDAVHAMGLRVLRVSIGWDEVEPRRGRFDFAFWDAFVALAGQRGIRLVPYVCYTPGWAARGGFRDAWTAPPRDAREFGRVMHELAARYRGRVGSWELWNEPDNPAYWSGTTAQFAELVRAGAAAVREADPGAKVVLGGLAWDLRFLERLLAEEHLAPSIDVVNLHNYFETWSDDPLESLPQYVGRAVEIVQRYGESEPLWLAEIGYSTFRRGAHVSDVVRVRFRQEHTRPYQAIALWRALALTLSTGHVDLVTWYRLSNVGESQDVIGDANNRHLGVLEANDVPKPARDALALFASLLGGQPVRPIDDSVTVRRTIGSDSEAHAFERADGTVVIALWLRTRKPGKPPAPGADAPDLRAERLDLELSARAASPSVTARDAEGRDLAPPRVRVDRGHLAIEQVEVTGTRATILVVAPRKGV